MVGVMAVELDAPPPPERVRETVEALARTTPRLAARFADGEWVPASDLRGAVDAIFHEGTVDLGACTLDGAALLAGCGWEVHYARATRRLVVAVHHALCDGFGAATILDGLLHCLDDSPSIGVEAVAPASVTTELDTEWLRDELRRTRAYATDFVATPEPPGSPHFDHEALSAKDVGGLVARARKEVPFASFNDVVMTALHEALGELSPHDVIGVLMPLNLRRYLPAPIAVANLSGATFVATRASERTNADLLDRIARRSLALQEHAVEASMVEPMERSRTPLLAHALFTNLGRLDLGPRALRLIALEAYPLVTARTSHTALSAVLVGETTHLYLHTRRTTNAQLLRLVVLRLRQQLG